MALDEAIAESVRNGESPPTLRVYEWLTPSVTIGFFQRISSVNLDFCTEQNIPVIRRITGGRGILHDEELTYSFSAPVTEGPFSRGLIDSYQKISQAFCRALSGLGLQAEARLTRQREETHSAQRNPLCFHSLSFAEITLGKKKILGSAQKRWYNGLLQQGSLPFMIDESLVKMVFPVDPSVKIADRMTGLRETIPHLMSGKVKNAIRSAFEEVFVVTLQSSEPSPKEIHRSRDVDVLKYQSSAWNHQR